MCIYEGFPGSSDGEESTCNVGDLDLIPGLGRSPGGGHGNPVQYSCLENPHGQRSLVGYSPRGHQELDMIEQLSKVQYMILLPFHNCFGFIFCKSFLPFVFLD